MHLAPLSRYQAWWDFALMSPWYSAGYGWPSSCGKRYGRRRVCWSGFAENVWSCETCRVALRSFGTEVLRWNVAGGGFLSLISNMGDLEPGMADSFFVGELIPRPQLTHDLNDSTSASAVHMMVYKHVDEHTHTLNWSFPQSLFSAFIQFCVVTMERQLYYRSCG